MSPPSPNADLLQRYLTVRGRTERLFAPLVAADWRIQSMPDVSPPWWNFGHTSWFFVANVLRPAGVPFADWDGFDYALNSYYEGLGPRLPRAMRGRVAQPDDDAVRAYRRAVDSALVEWLQQPRPIAAEFAASLTIGLEHEEQHQELFLTEILHIRAAAPEPLRRAYRAAPAAPPAADPGPLRAIGIPGGRTRLGHDGAGFAWDNELPAHDVLVPDFGLGDRLITNGEWLAFLDDGGYRRPLLWLSNGWAAVQQHGWQAPLYWRRNGAEWHRFTLHGERPVDPHAPVCHVSFYEAEAFARWYAEQFAAFRHARLPRECEWEHAARAPFDQAGGNLLDDDLARSALDPTSARGAGLRQVAGDAWEWTQSHYEPYPGYRPFPGALTEYNGKFMDNQRVLRGGSWATPRRQARVGYRNFWPADTRFQATGVRLLVDR